MRESLLSGWCHAPWHAWLKEERAWLGLFAELWSRVPAHVTERILGSPRVLVVLPPVVGSRVVRITHALPAGAHVLQLDPGLLSRPESEAVAILAHELAHLCADPHDDAFSNDFEADHLVVKWGLGDALARALERDLGCAHPRTEAVRGKRAG